MLKKTAVAGKRHASFDDLCKATKRFLKATRFAYPVEQSLYADPPPDMIRANCRGATALDHNIRILCRQWITVCLYTPLPDLLWPLPPAGACMGGGSTRRMTGPIYRDGLSPRMSCLPIT